MASDGCSHWCHNCKTPVWPHGPCSLCPYCNQGFVEEVSSQFADAHSASWFNHFFPDTARSFFAPFLSPEEDHRVDPRIRPGMIPLLGPMHQHSHHDHRDGHWGGPNEYHQPVVEDEVLEAILRLSVDEEHCGPPRASGSAIRALPTVNVSARHLNSEGRCPVCQQRFELGSNARQMPCDHIFHTDCIVPWLELHNTCPVCRFQLPSSSSSSSSSSSRRRTRGDSARNHGSRNPLSCMWPPRRSYR